MLDLCNDFVVVVFIFGCSIFKEEISVEHISVISDMLFYLSFVHVQKKNVYHLNTKGMGRCIDHSGLVW